MYAQEYFSLSLEADRRSSGGPLFGAKSRQFRARKLSPFRLSSIHISWPIRPIAADNPLPSPNYLPMPFEQKWDGFPGQPREWKWWIVNYPIDNWLGNLCYCLCIPFHDRWLREEEAWGLIPCILMSKNTRSPLHLVIRPFDALSRTLSYFDFLVETFYGQFILGDNHYSYLFKEFRLQTWRLPCWCWNQYAEALEWILMKCQLWIRLLILDALTITSY